MGSVPLNHCQTKHDKVYEDQHELTSQGDLVDRNEITQANRDAWNEATTKHQAARKDELKPAFGKPGYSTLDEHITAKLHELGLAGKNVTRPHTATRRDCQTSSIQSSQAELQSKNSWSTSTTSTGHSGRLSGKRESPCVTCWWGRSHNFWSLASIVRWTMIDVWINIVFDLEGRLPMMIPADE